MFITLGDIAPIMIYKTFGMNQTKRVGKGRDCVFLTK